MSVRFPMHIGMKYSKVGVKNIITDCQEKRLDFCQIKIINCKLL